MWPVTENRLALQLAKEDPPQYKAEVKGRRFHPVSVQYSLIVDGFVASRMVTLRNYLYQVR